MSLLSVIHSYKLRGVLPCLHRRFSFLAARSAWLLLLCVWICALIAPARVEAVVLPPSKIASWGFEANPSGRLGEEVPANQYSTRGYEAYGYESASGRAEWQSRDPIGEQGGINLYGYVGNNPINGIDPLGLWQVTVYGGATLGGYLSFGYSPSTGQRNFSVRIGGGVGVSASYDPSDGGCKKGGFIPLSMAGSAGNLLAGIGAEGTAGPDAVYYSVSGRLGLSTKTWGGSVGGPNGNVAPSFSDVGVANSDMASFKSPIWGGLNSPNIVEDSLRLFKNGKYVGGVAGFAGFGYTKTYGGNCDCDNKK